LVGEAVGHGVDVVGQVLPDARHTLDVGPASELALRADLAGHPGDLVGEGVQLVDHGVDGVLQGQHLTLHVHLDLLGEIARSEERKSTRLNSSHVSISYAVFCLKKKKKCYKLMWQVRY